jgi:hypothetical protein
VLFGRESEGVRIERLLGNARGGRAGALVIRGDPGVGKTALLRYAIDLAEAMTVVRATGVESEAELEFSGLLELCRPLLEGLDGLPEHQADALRGALGLGASRSGDRFAVGAAVLSLLAHAAENRPLLVAIDDAHWLDDASADALRFAARRLMADPVALLFTARGEEWRFDAAGVDELTLEGLDREAARRLLDHVAGAEVDDEVVAHLHDATGGNALALVELPGQLSAAQLAGTQAIVDPLPVGQGIERAFTRRIAGLPEDARRALVVLAVAGSDDLLPAARALARLGLDPRSIEPAEDAALVRIDDGRFAFDHPLVRSVVFQGAPPSERRAAHRALADVLSDGGAAERRAWHLASAALGPDEQAADALAAAAARARERSGYAAASAAFERAARLSPEREIGLERLGAAAEAAWHAGRTEVAANLVAETLAGTRDERLRADALRLQGAIEYFAGRGDAAAAALLEALTLLGRSDPHEAVAVAADAVNALIRVRRPAEALETARTARLLAPEDGGVLDLEATAALAFALCFNGRYGEAEPHLRRASEIFGASTAVPGPLQAGRLSTALGWLGRHGEAQAYLAETVERARAVGAVGSLPHLLSGAAWQALHAGRWNEAYADASEALELAEEIDQPITATQALGVLTWLDALRGDEASCRAHGEETRRRARAFGFTLYQHLVSHCLALLDLGAGRVDEAVGRLEEIARHADERGLYIPGVAPQFELAEACARAGRDADAEAIIASFQRSQLASVPYLSALAERCRGLLADADRFETHFLAALALHAKTESPFALARTRLCFGERLRRAGRRVDSRRELRAALATFERLGATAWIERARRELRATGEKLGRRAARSGDELTPQELQIALHVAEGKTNRDVGGRRSTSARRPWSSTSRASTASSTSPRASS